ncbi:MAG TPA: immunoglobulin-like domain-containing protein, partial [Xanthobacteraceae bacterium]|nr:immunoglobulin-like domain-containing protein [Xanthobacteraceae bacterium]
GQTSPSGEGSGGASSDDTEATDTPPIIQINGDNPAIVQVGDTYNDLGATITGPQADLNLGIQTFVNGVAMSPVVIDTSAAATDTIDYVATDQNGLTSTTTRTVIVEAPSIAPSDDASTTSATSTDATTTAE